MNNPSPKPSLLEALQQDVLVLDGAMGTQLNSLGIAFDRCFELANLDNPEWVERIHRDFLNAGAAGIHTNTFAANRFKLNAHGLADRQVELLTAGVARARAAADQGQWVLGALGPLGIEVEPFGRLAKAEARAAFREALEVLVAGGVDALAFETFSSPDELAEAVTAAKDVADLPVIAQFAVDREGRTLYGTSVADCADQLKDAGADIIGVNCSGGPRTVFNGVQQLIKNTDLPVSARPNAGLPRQLDGRVFYENNPDYFARFARRFFQAGGRLLGGCCGTTPDHIRAMVRAVRAAGAQERGMKAEHFAQPKTKESRPQKPLQLRRRSGFGRLLADKACPVSVELVPPKTPDLTKLREAARQLQAAGADLINLPDGPRASARVSNAAAAVVLQKEAGVETLLHFCCRDRNLLGMQSDLMGAEALGLRNLLVVTGDPPYQGNYPNLTAVFDVDSIGLCNIVDNLNHGLDLGGNRLDTQTNFVVGCALNPTALDPQRELERFEWKVKAGVDYAITQPIFDVEGFLDFIKQLPADAPPILAGVWPLRSLRNAEFLASEVPGVEIPASVLELMRKADASGKAGEEGIALGQATLEALHGKVAGFQLAAPFNQVEAPVALLNTLNDLRG